MPSLGEGLIDSLISHPISNEMSEGERMGLRGEDPRKYWCMKNYTCLLFFSSPLSERIRWDTRGRRERFQLSQVCLRDWMSYLNTTRVIFPLIWPGVYSKLQRYNKKLFYDGWRSFVIRYYIIACFITCNAGALLKGKNGGNAVSSLKHVYVLCSSFK